VDPFQVASSSQASPYDSDYAASPGADSDPYSFPNTPAGSSRAMSEEYDEDTLVRAHDMRLRFWIYACGLD